MSLTQRLITPADYSSTIIERPVVVLKIGNELCLPSRSFDTRIESIMEDYRNDIRVLFARVELPIEPLPFEEANRPWNLFDTDVEVNTDDEAVRAMLEKTGRIRNVPVVHVFKNGNLRKKVPTASSVRLDMAIRFALFEAVI